MGYYFCTLCKSHIKENTVKKFIQYLNYRHGITPFHNPLESPMAQTAKRRREWISDVNPTITEIIQAFPHFTDTPGMVGKTKRIEYKRTEFL